MTKNKDFFLELGCEEIPARFISSLSLSLQLTFEKFLVKNRIQFESIKVLSTYRRLALYVKKVSTIQDDSIEYVKGPPEKIVYDDNGDFSKASIGFAKKNNIDLSKCIIKEINGKKHLSYESFLKGKPTNGILSEIIPQIITSIPLNIAMKWADKTHQFVRPVKWIVALFDAEVINFKLFDVNSSNYSFGHRFLSNGETSLGKKFTVNLKKSILDQYQNHKVLLDSSKRETSIKQQLLDYDQQNLDKDLLSEVVNLVEMPFLLKGEFDSKYLDLPDFVLIECMKKHQRYFPVYVNGKLQPSFLVVADNVTPENKKTIISGNQNVLIARLEDAMFFYQKDLSENLQTFVSKLDGVVFQKNAGSMLDKQERIYEILKFFKEKQIIAYEDSVLSKVANYSKCDLVTNMVLEFPSLQGKMGAIYLEAAKEDSLITVAVKEQYLPAGQSTKMPSTHLGAILGLADRFDTLAVSFMCGANPTGSQDPLGLRRAVIGICDLIFETNISLNIKDVITFCLDLKKYDNELIVRILDFFYLRIKTLFKDKNIDYDIVDAIKDLLFVDLCESLKIANTLQMYKNCHFEKLKLISETAVRVSRLAKNAKGNELKENLFEEKIESDLYDEYKQIVSYSSLDLDNYFSFSKSFSIYFEHILVMSDNDVLKQNRLSFLKQADHLFKRVANFEKIAM